MLQFAKGVPLGEKGLEWLKIHLVNLHGAKKKASLLERAQYADDMMDEIKDSADNPLTVSLYFTGPSLCSDIVQVEFHVSRRSILPGFA